MNPVILPAYFPVLTFVYFPITLFTVMGFPWYRYLKYPKKSKKLGIFFLLLGLFLLPFLAIVVLRPNSAERNLSLIGIYIFITSSLISLLVVFLIQWLEKLIRHSK